MGNHIIEVSSSKELTAADSKDFLSKIRPEWKSKDLIERTRRLLSVDPSSACQRLLNATIHDLREKIIHAGLDIAKDVSKQANLPSITKPEDITENYTTARIIDLAYRMGILTRPEWRKITRCYEIRGDLEHEDVEYEADIDDVYYIFKNCVEIVLSRDPIELIRVEDIKELVKTPETPVITSETIEEFKQAPNSRQHEIIVHLINTAMNSEDPDILRQNAMELLKQFEPVTKKQVQIDATNYLQMRYKKKPLDLLVAKVAYVAGIFPYLKQRKVYDFFEGMYSNLTGIGHRWTNHTSHRQPLEDLEDVGGLINCPQNIRQKIVLWMVKCYLGEKGGYGMGHNRKVFYSNGAAPRIEKMFKSSSTIIREDFSKAKKDKAVKESIKYGPIARRLEKLEDLISDIN